MTPDEANAFFDKLRTDGVDCLLLLYLQLPESITRDYPALCLLHQQCTDKGWGDQLRTLMAHLQIYMKEKGVLPVSTKRYVMARTRDQVIANYHKVKATWGAIHMPYMFQTFSEGMQGMVFFICANPQDALIRMLDILTQGCVVFTNNKTYDACGILEHTLDEYTIVRQLFDCETMVSFFDTLITKEEIIKDMQEIPAAISQRLAQSELVNPETVVNFDIKQRSRKKKDDFKPSLHILSNIYAPRNLHEAASKQLLGPDSALPEFYSSGLRKHKCYKSFITKETLPAPGTFARSLLYIDSKVLPGSPNGITSLFSRKAVADPFPIYAGSQKTCLGVVFGVTPCQFPRPHDLASKDMTPKDRLELLCNISRTVPQFNTDIITYEQSFIQRFLAGKVGGGVAGARVQVPKALDPCPRPLASSSSSALPEWFTSALVSATGKNSRIGKIPKNAYMLPEWAKENIVGDLMHVMPCYCVNSIVCCGEMRIHKSNGTNVAVVRKPEKKDEYVLLMCCPHKDHKIRDNMFPGVIPLASSHDSKLLLGEENAGQIRSGILWVVIDGEKGFREIIRVLGEEAARNSKRQRVMCEVNEEKAGAPEDFPPECAQEEQGELKKK